MEALAHSLQILLTTACWKCVHYIIIITTTTTATSAKGRMLWFYLCKNIR